MEPVRNPVSGSLNGGLNGAYYIASSMLHIIKQASTTHNFLLTATLLKPWSMYSLYHDKVSDLIKKHILFFNFHRQQ